MYLTARIADSRPFDGGSELRFRVGCEFTGRFAAEPVIAPGNEKPSPASPALPA